MLIPPWYHMVFFNRVWPIPLSVYPCRSWLWHWKLRKNHVYCLWMFLSGWTTLKLQHINNPKKTNLGPSDMGMAVFKTHLMILQMSIVARNSRWFWAIPSHAGETKDVGQMVKPFSKNDGEWRDKHLPEKSESMTQTQQNFSYYVAHWLSHFAIVSVSFRSASLVHSFASHELGLIELLGNRWTITCNYYILIHLRRLVMLVHIQLWVTICYYSSKDVTKDRYSEPVQIHCEAFYHCYVSRGVNRCFGLSRTSLLFGSEWLYNL